MEQQLLNEQAVAVFLGVSRAWLRERRMSGIRRGLTPGPPYVRLGRAIRYDLRDLEQWIATQKVGGSADV